MKPEKKAKYETLHKSQQKYRAVNAVHEGQQCYVLGDKTAHTTDEQTADKLVRGYIDALVADKRDDAAEVTKRMVDYVFNKLPAALPADEPVAKGEEHMISKHTSGPWRKSDCGHWSASHDGIGSICYQGIKDELGNVVALAVAHDLKPFGDLDTEANARLIAAAPELLEALQGMLASFCDIDCGEFDRKLAVKDARAAIVKATGENS